MSTVLIVSVAAAIILVIGGGLLMYMSNLVKSAYELKVQINADIDARLAKMAEDIDKKSRWIKRDLLEEIDKIKVALETENARRFEALAEPLLRNIEDLDSIIRNERAEWTAAIESDRENITRLDGRIAGLRQEIRDAKPATPPALPADGTSDAAPAADTPPPATPVIPPISAAVAEVLRRQATDSRTMSQFLPDLGRKR